MKKIFLISGVTIMTVTAATALVLPYWFGREAETTYHAMLERLSQGSLLQFTGKNYERGWFHSTAETVIRVPDTPFEVVAQHQIHHGPWPHTRVRSGEWRPAQAHITSEVLVRGAAAGNSATVPVNTDIILHLNGSGRVHAEMPPSKHTGARDQHFDWQGLSANIHFDREWKVIQVSAQIPSLNVSTPGQGGLSVSKIAFRSDMRAGTAGYYFGDATFTVDQLEASSERGRAGLRGLEVSSVAKPVNDNVHMTLGYRFDTLQADEARYGPGQLILELRHLDAAALMKFKNEVDTLYRGGRPPPQAAMMLAGMTLELMASLSKKAPELEITRMSFHTGVGEISGKAKFVLDGRKTDLAQNPMLLLTALAGDVEIALPLPVVKQVLTPLVRRDIENYRRAGALSEEDMARLDPAALARIVDRVYTQYLPRHDFTRHLVEENGRYVLRLTLRRGQMQLNGKPWHLPARGTRTL